jgi:hypothetical protein
MAMKTMRSDARPQAPDSMDAKLWKVNEPMIGFI